MEKVRLSVKKTARLLEAAAQKERASFDVSCSIGEHLEMSGGDFSDDIFEKIRDAVSRLAFLPHIGKRNYKRAARELIEGVTVRYGRGWRPRGPKKVPRLTVSAKRA